jgi:hypothetical protein
VPLRLSGAPSYGVRSPELRSSAKIYNAHICLDYAKVSTMRQKFPKFRLGRWLWTVSPFTPQYSSQWRVPQELKLRPPWIVDELSLHKPIKSLSQAESVPGLLSPVDKPPVSYRDSFKDMQSLDSQCLRLRFFAVFVLVSGLLNDPR